MQRYVPQGHRPMFGIAAVALTVLTIAMMVVGPAELAPGVHVMQLTGGASGAAAAREVDIDPSRIEVVVDRDSGLAVAGAQGASPKHGHRG